MLEYAQALRVAAPPGAVWKLITDLNAYETWTAAVRAQGRAETGQSIDFVIIGRRGGRSVSPIRFQAHVETAQPAERLAWVCGVPGLLAVRYGFDLQTCDRGTRVRHFAEVSGLATRFIRWRLDQIFPPLLTTVAADLSRRIAKRGLIYDTRALKARAARATLKSARKSRAGK